ncbi:MAG: L,D-transpeptidase family protein [Bacteroidales bacterium]
MMQFNSYLLSSLFLFACTGVKEKPADIDRETQIRDSILQITEQRFAASYADAAGNIRLIIENRQQGERYKALDIELYSSVLLPQYYVENRFEPLWFPHYDSLNKFEQMILFLENLGYQGLDPNHYHYQEIKEQWELMHEDPEIIFSGVFIANTDALLSDAYFMLASHLYHGKVDPETQEAQWGIRRNKPNLPLDIKLWKMLKLETIEDGFRHFYPPHPGYEAMILEARKLSHHQEENFQIVAAAKTLPIKPGESSPIVPEIKNKLLLLGYYGNDSGLMDNTLDSIAAEAVKKLQLQFGLNTDGAVGPNTLKALNMPVEQRLKQLYVNMERLRWMPDSLETKYILVNIADFTLYMMHDADTLISMRSIVGKNYRKTPVFNSKITYLVFSPTWTIPPGIQRNDIIPAVIKNPDYLAEKNMRVFNLQGQVIDPSTINWRRDGMRFTIRQAPGKQNALGLVKFMFPNKHNIYLHDTPSRELFARDERTFSSGCIRIEKPFELSELLLADMPQWTPERIRLAMNAGVERSVILDSPVGIYLYYLTAWGGSEGVIHYRSDIYERDDIILQALGERHTSWN